MAEQRYCNKCRKTMADTNFYTYKNGSKCELCKGCLTMHINNFDSETFLWLLEKFDVPYIPAEWNVLRDRAYAKDPYKMNGMSVFGKYLSKMKLKQWKGFTWADTDRLQAEAEEKAKLYGEPEKMAEEKIAEMKEAYERGEITESQWLTYKEISAPEPEFKVVQGTVTTAGPGANIYPVNDNPFEKVDIPDVGADLTQEDKIYLAMKWGRLYSLEDWVTLEKTYDEYNKSFDIHNADLQKGLTQLCKLDLKLNQAIDSGDFDSYAKLYRSYDALRKSLKFTEAQNKDGAETEFDSVGAIVAFCETEKGGGYIPEMKITAPLDIIDTIIFDNKEYLQSLWQNDPNISQLITQFLKKQEILAEQKADRKKAKEQGSFEVGISDKDYMDFYKSIEDDVQQDLQNLKDSEEE